MPKAFTDTERTLIRERLESAAEVVMNTGSIRKASVDELASAADISKGAFYLFFPTKEMLFFAVIMKKHEEIEVSLVTRIEALTNPGEADVTAIILEYFRETAASFFPRLVSCGELEYLMRRLPEDAVKEHLLDDTDFLLKIVGAVPALSPLLSLAKKNEIASLYSSSLRAVFLLSLHRQEIGEGQFERVIAMFVESITEKLFAEAKK